MASPIDSIRSVFKHLDGILEQTADIYRDIHAHPELAGAEARTAAIFADAMEDAGFEVTRGFGGHGVVGMLANGPGPVVAIRADMDALPVLEDTGLPYASTRTVTLDDGTTVPVMHACGHDMNVACTLGAAVALAAGREHWSGTLMVIGQPAEETMEGAADMLAAGLFTTFPRPDVVLGQHVGSTRSGMVSHLKGTLCAGVRNLRVRIHGKGGHGADPHAAVDPVVIAAQLVLALQTVVSREIDPIVPAVLTVGSLHTGTRPNVIPTDAVLEITTRGTGEPVLDQIQEAIERIARGLCAAARADEPTVEVFERVYATINDADVVERVRGVHLELFGPDDVVDFPAMGMGGEDFALYAVPGPGRYDGDPIPAAYWGFGSVPEALWEKTTGNLLERATQVPMGHTPFFAPELEPSLRRGTEAMSSAALSYLAT